MGEWACFGNLTMKRGGKQVWACDCETDPFDHGAEIRPFIWGLYDGKEFWTFNSTISFVQFVRSKRIILYAHNGGKFDFMFLCRLLSKPRHKSSMDGLCQCSLAIVNFATRFRAFPCR